MKKRSAGFTIVELITVIAIIAMLAVLLLPSIRNSIRKGQQGKCISNLRLIGVAVQQYVADPENFGQFPPIYNVNASYSSGATANSSIASATALQPLQTLSNYGLTLTTLTCPSDKTPDPTYGSYLWSPVIQGEQPQDVHVYGHGGVFTLSKLSGMTVCTDKGYPHPGSSRGMGSFNVLRADGHVESRP